ncbi:MAG TPA: Sec-independent protein translocase protein TatB [Pseudobdellovibrionaceae bacterium]|nr:Sec-independent protein translocase protein TatB [Pseudobdellovibrionaceae bacterium]
MFDIGFSEMILIAVIALVAIGPKQLPEVARTVGKFIGEFKRMFGDVATSFIDARDGADRELRKFKDDVKGSVFSQARHEDQSQARHDDQPQARHEDQPQAHAATQPESATHAPETHASESPAAHSPVASSQSSASDSGEKS